MKIILLTIIASFLFVGCQCAPRKTDKELSSCYMFRDCMYRNQKNKDKSVCIDFAKECRAYRRFIFCRKIKGMTFERCQLYLNQK